MIVSYSWISCRRGAIHLPVGGDMSIRWEKKAFYSIVFAPDGVQKRSLISLALRATFFTALTTYTRALYIHIFPS